MAKTEAIIALGANLNGLHGSPRDLIKSALGILHTGRKSTIHRLSRFFRTPAFPAGSGPDYVNTTALLETDLNVNDFLQRCHEVEVTFGRTRNDERWSARVLDIDLIAAGQQIVPDRNTVNEWIEKPLSEQMTTAPDQLILPHPRLQDRGFVLYPMADIAPDWRHPILGLTTIQMRDALPPEAKEGVVPLTTSQLQAFDCN